MEVTASSPSAGPASPGAWWGTECRGGVDSNAPRRCMITFIWDCFCPPCCASSPCMSSIAAAICIICRRIASTADSCWTNFSATSL